MSNEVVTVVDDSVVITRLVVTVVVTDVEERYITQITICHVSHVNQVTADFAEQDSTVGNRLQLVEDTSDTIHRVGRLIQMFLFGEDDLFRALIEEVRAG